MAVGDLLYWYDEVQFDLSVGGGIQPATSGESYKIHFAPINYDRTHSRMKEIRIESVCNQDYAASSRYTANLQIKDASGNIVATVTNNISWSFLDVGATKGDGGTSGINNNDTYTVDGQATYSVLPGVAPFTTARCRCNLRVYYVVEVTSDGTVLPPGSGGGGQVTPPKDPYAWLYPIVIVGGLGIGLLVAATAAGREFRSERAEGGSTFGAITKELSGVGRGLKSVLKF